jgi:hypothetical protein
MRRLLFLLSLLAVMACSLTGSPSPTAEGPPNYVGLGLGALKTYRANFEVHFEGDSDWIYCLESRADGHAVEYRLHLDGVDDTLDPGDVRAVIEGDIGRMRGAGTGDECLQFPSDLDLGLSFLSPDDLINLKESTASLIEQDSEVIAGVQAVHYTLSQVGFDGWRNLEAELWQDETTGAVLRYDLRAEGLDPLFDAGEGVLSWRFLVEEIGPQTIEPIAGCEIDLPLPPDATRLVRLPGLVAFESATAVAEIVAFYQAELTKLGWELVAEPQVGADATLSSYHRGGQTLDINVEATEEGSHVEWLLSGQ